MNHKMSDDQIRVMAPMLAQMVLGEKKFTRQEMADALGITLHKVETIEKSDVYQGIFADLAKKSKGLAENTLKGQTLLIRATLNEYTSKAVDTLYELMTTSKVPQVRLGAACEILDRDGRFAKVSRLMNVQQGAEGAPMLPEDEAAQILDALKAYGEKKVSVQ